MATSTSIILLLVFGIANLCSTIYVDIQPSESEHCRRPATLCYNITTFGKIADSFSNSSGLVVHFFEGTHLLDLHELVVFTSLTDAVFEGDGRMEQGFHETVWQSTVVIKCTEHSNTGIAFVNSSNITFRYITIANCGADMTTLFLANNDWFFNNTSLGFFFVDNGIIIDHVSVRKGMGSGLVVLTNGSNLNISNSSFVQEIFNSLNEANVVIFYTDQSNSASRKDSYKTFITSTNVSYSLGNDEEITNGGCLSISMLQRFYVVDIVLDSVVVDGKKKTIKNIMIASNVIDWPNYNLSINKLHSFNSDGAGLVIITKQDMFTVTNTTLYHNFPFSSVMPNLTILILNSYFFHNCHHKSAYNQGRIISGIAVFFEGVKYSSRVRIESTEISHNIGFDVNGLFLSSYSYQSQFYVVLLNVSVNNNGQLLIPYSEEFSVAIAAIHAEFITSLVLNNVSITNNNSTGLFVYHTAVVVNGTSVFHNNTGIDGGGLSMYGESYLVLNENSFLVFTNNSAIRGGAIFVETNSQLAKSACFFQFSDYKYQNEIKATFSGNNATVAGSVLFGGETDDCIVPNLGHLSSTECLNKMFNYTAQKGSSQPISSVPMHACFCKNNKVDCSKTKITKKVYPGGEISISVATVGRSKKKIVPGKIQVYSLNCASKNEVFNTSASECTIVKFKPVFDNYSLNVYNKPFNSIKIRIVLVSSCPLGFNRSHANKCDCGEQLGNFNTTITCNATSNTITRQGDKWIGNISDCVLVYTQCPFDYCNPAQVSFSFNDPDPQCALNRSGMLCGGCKQNYSLALGSNSCIDCTGSFHLALIIPFAAAGFGLVALLMVLNLTVSIGTINGLIFYASIVKISESTGIFFPNGSIPVLSQFIAWLNLDLGIETCFYQGMTAYAKVWLQFVFPLYIWFIIATIIVLCRYSTWLSKNIGGNVVQVFATLILLSFTKLFRTFAPALTWIILPCENGIAVWCVDATVPYSSSDHAALIAAAGLFLLLAVPYILALLFDAVIEKYLTQIKFLTNLWIKFKPFFDAYNGPYKDSCRFWTGLLLLVRMSFTLASLRLNTFGTLIFITASTTVLLSLMVTFEGVYQKKYLNILECSFFLNLGLLSALAAVYQDHENKGEMVTIISLGVALVTFVGILFFHVILRTKNSKWFRKYVKKFCRRRNEESKLLTDVSSNEPPSKPTSSDVFLKRETLIECSTE